MMVKLPSIVSSHVFLTIVSVVVISYLIVLRGRRLRTTNPLSSLPTVTRASWAFGNRMDRRPDEVLPGMSGARMLDEAGEGVHTIAYPDVLGNISLLTKDPVAIAHILNDASTYQRDSAGTKATKILIGEGLVAAFGDDHRKQRKMLGPAFSPEVLKSFVPIMFQAAHNMVEKMDGDTEGSERFAAPNAADVLKWLSRATLDIIGLAGFDFAFEAVNQGSRASAVRDSFNAAMTALMTISPFSLIVTIVGAFIWPSVAMLPITDDNIKLLRMRRTLIACSKDIVARKRVEIEEELSISGDMTERKDVLHLSMRANLLASPQNRLTDEQLAGQIVTFIFAGHETTAATLAWSLWFIAQDEAVQAKLHSTVDSALLELAPDGSDLTWDQLHSPSLRYLDDILTETLRLRPPVVETLRYSLKRDTIPFSSPIISPTGEKLASTDILPGTNVTLAVAANMVEPKYFGQRAREFDPERFASLPELHAKSKFPASGTFAFSHGPKSCIGYRFAMVEMKILLVTLMKTYSVSTVDGLQMRSIDAIVQRPAVAGREKEGSQMPLRLTRRDMAS